MHLHSRSRRMCGMRKGKGRWGWAVVAAWMAVCGTGLATADGPETRPVESTLQSVCGLIAHGRFDQGRQRLEQAISGNPQDAALRSLSGWVDDWRRLSEKRR